MGQRRQLPPGFRRMHFSGCPARTICPPPEPAPWRFIQFFVIIRESLVPDAWVKSNILLHGRAIKVVFMSARWVCGVGFSYFRCFNLFAFLHN